jgi:hypothetical protein
MRDTNLCPDIDSDSNDYVYDTYDDDFTCESTDDHDDHDDDSNKNNDYLDLVFTTNCYATSQIDIAELLIRMTYISLATKAKSTHL